MAFGVRQFGGGGVLTMFSTYFTEGCTDLPLETICTKGSVPEFLRTPIATCDFPGDPDPLPPYPLDPARLGVISPLL